mmetsp:Transcript_8263/g.23315  ORF Transcript_8263/g.23315 Transcript_8263/m.23315 type:complete len:234 (+) Transcript_8263:3314-4015(+)
MSESRAAPISAVILSSPSASGFTMRTSKQCARPRASTARIAAYFWSIDSGVRLLRRCMRARAASGPAPSEGQRHTSSPPVMRRLRSRLSLNHWSVVCAESSYQSVSSPPVVARTLTRWSATASRTSLATLTASRAARRAAPSSGPPTGELKKGGSGVGTMIKEPSTSTSWPASPRSASTPLRKTRRTRPARASCASSWRRTRRSSRRCWSGTGATCATSSRLNARAARTRSRR